MPTAPDPSPGAARAPRRDAVRNDRRVLDAARAVFAERGIQAGMEEIAERAGVGIGTIYRRFASKDALLDAIATQLTRELERAADTALDRADGSGFEWFLDYVGEFNSAKRPYSSALVGRVVDDEAATATWRKVDALRVRAIDAGRLAPDVTAAEVKALVLALGAVVQSSDDPDTWRRFLRRHLTGLREPRSS